MLCTETICPDYMPMTVTFACPHCLYDHLRDTLSAERLAALECLALESGKRIEDGCEHQHHSRCDQAARPLRNARPLYDAHAKVESGAEIVGLEFPDKSIELGRRRADAEEQRHFEEQNHGRVYSGTSQLCVCDRGRHCSQAYDAKRNEETGVEEVGNAERKAQEYADHTRPALKSVFRCAPVCFCLGSKSRLID